ncbi:MAG: hydrogen peroxide-dependent heme synthase [Chthonomonadales bacterium]
MAESPGTLDGWYALHDFRSLDWARWNNSPEADRAKILSELAATLQGFESTSEGGSAAFSVIGHKADILILHLRPTLRELGELETEFNQTQFAAFCNPTYSYVSITELSLYEATARGGTEDIENLMTQPFVRARLYPEVPDTEYVCFYPMNKKRGETVNWYTDDFEARRAMMREHGATGRKYAGRVKQMITGSMGLDDWEWGITLFADNPLDIKHLVYEMRFDEVSAKYAEFGKFLMGVRVKPEELAARFAGK